MVGELLGCARLCAMPGELVERRIETLLRDSLDAFRAVVVQGARQVGKSTLVGYVAAGSGFGVVSLDREEDLRAALGDPGDFLRRLGAPAVIDEVQRGGDRLVLAIKQRLDADRAAGQLILTGSSNFLTTPALSESLAGRIDLLTLWPLSMGELSSGSDGFVDRAFAGDDALVDHDGITPARATYLDLICRGGYPEVQRLPPRARRRWFDRYVETVLRREVETAADLRRFDALVALTRLLIARTGAEVVASRLAQDVGIDRATAEAYLPWIESTFLVHRLPAWSRSAGTKVVHRPKMHVCDTGLGAAVVGKDAAALDRRNEPMTGPLFESFAIAEIAKQLTWSETSARLHHFRDRDGVEVDAVIEAADGRVVGVEVKASTVPRPEDATPLRVLRDRLDRAGGEFTAGIVLHTGDRRARLGDRLVGLPLADLWT
jgi:hypothetical protein